MAGEVGGGADEGGAERVEQLLAEGELWNAHAYGAVGGGEVVGDGDGEHSGGQDDGGGAGAVEQQLEGLGGCARREHLFGGENEHGLAVVALLDGVDAFHGVGIGGVAADAPDGVGGVEEGEALAKGGEN